MHTWQVRLLLALLAAASMWLYVQSIVIPFQVADAQARQTPRGNLSDLYPRWLGARELLLHRRDPYGADLTKEIQMGYYGRALDPARPNDPKDQQAFAYPLYVVLLLAPTVTLPFAAVHRVCFWLFVFLTAWSVFLWLQTMDWRLSRTAKIIWMLLTVSCFPAIQGLELQQLTILVAALIAMSMRAVVRQHLIWAGILLGLATIKPQLVVLLVLCLCVWVVGRWHERQALLSSFAITMVLLIAAGELLLPGWISEFRRAMASYYRYTEGANSLLDMALTPTGGRITSAVLVALLLRFSWNLRHSSERSREFQWLLSLIMATTLLVIRFSPYNEILLLPAVMIFLRSIPALWKRGGISRFFVAMNVVPILWPYVAAVALVTAMLVEGPQPVQKFWAIPFYPVFAIPITMYALLLASRSVLSSANKAALTRALRQSVASE